MNDDSKRRELEVLREQVGRLESELSRAKGGAPWQATEYYAAYYATTGFLLGAVAATTSLLFNVIGSTLFREDPLQLIRVYLTFPLGERALEFTTADNGLTLTIGACLYLGTGMLLGIPFQLILARLAPGSTFAKRFVVVTILSVALWLFNFYGVLAWLQPMLFGEAWIVREIPPGVAVATHLVFGWTMLLIYPLGLYTPYRLQTEKS
jgi:hypothetical protein